MVGIISIVEDKIRDIKPKYLGHVIRSDESEVTSTVLKVNFRCEKLKERTEKKKVKDRCDFGLRWLTPNS